MFPAYLIRISGRKWKHTLTLPQLWWRQLPNSGSLKKGDSISLFITRYHSICIKNVCLFLLLCIEFKCIPETCFLFLFFPLIPAPPHPSLSSLFPFFYFVFVSFCCSPNFLSGFNFHVPALSQTTCSRFSTTPCDFPYLFVFLLFIFILKFEIRQLRAHLAQQDLDLAAEREAAMQIHHVWDKQGRNFQVVEGLTPGESDDEGGQRNPREPHVTSGIV